MYYWFVEQSPIIQALIAGIFTWLCTVAGSSVVFFVKNINEKFLAIMQGSAAGIMTAADFGLYLILRLNLQNKVPYLIGCQY